ncbi:retropepsin-like aspartic protease [Wenyingzhuangia sp. IMCC45467]
MKIFCTIIAVLLFLSSCKQDDSPKIQFLKGKLIDTIPFDYFKTGHIKVKASVNTNTYDFLLDTGASFSLFDKDLKCNGEHVYFDSEKSLRNINGDSFLIPYGTLIQKLNIGNIEINNFGYYRNELYQENLDGILGNNILKNLVFEIDFYNSELRFSKNIKNFNLTGYEDALPMPFYDELPHLDVNIFGKVFSMMIDVGNSEGFLSFNNKEGDIFNKNQRKIYNWKSLKQASVLDATWSKEHEEIESLGFSITDIEINQHKLSEQFIRFSNEPLRQVGLVFLRQFGKVIFDYPNSKLYLGKTNNKILLEQLLYMAKYINSNGVIFSNDNIRKVTAINPAAERQGIKLQDTLVSLAGKDLKQNSHKYPGSDMQITTETLLDNFYYVMDNKTVSLEFRSKDGLKKYELERQYPIKTLPDTVKSFGFTPKYIFVSPTAIQHDNYIEYKVRNLPKEIKNQKHAP